MQKQRFVCSKTKSSQVVSPTDATSAALSVVEPNSRKHDYLQLT
jgi:hypothetical protein